MAATRTAFHQAPDEASREASDVARVRWSTLARIALLRNPAGGALARDLVYDRRYSPPPHDESEATAQRGSAASTGWAATLRSVLAPGAAGGRRDVRGV